MENKILIILGSARKEGDTERITRKVFAGRKVTYVNLLEYPVASYRYDHCYPEDDAFERVVALLLEHATIVFATPVYWYAMSGRMKEFFDRFTDLVTVNKNSGRQLKGKRVYLLAVGAEVELPEKFELPFSRTADYLGMHYAGETYFVSDEDKLPGFNQKRKEIVMNLNLDIDQK